MAALKKTRKTTNDAQTARGETLDLPRQLPAGLPFEALDDRIAIVGTSGSGKTYTAKGLIERLLTAGARVAIIDPLGVWWGLRASADGIAPGYPVIVFGGQHADVPLTAEMGGALGRLIADQALACVVDVSELGSGAARRRFMTAFAEAIYDANREPLHLVLDEADLWTPQRPLPDQMGLLGRIEEIVRRGRIRGFIPWLITQRPAVVHKDVLSQADILIAMKLTASQDRDAIGAWIEGQADRQEGKRILGDLPRLQRGEGYLWAPGHGVLERVGFPLIRTFDSSRAPRRGERIVTPRTLAEVDLTAITAALTVVEAEAPTSRHDGSGRLAVLERQLAEAQRRIGQLEQEKSALASRLERIMALASGTSESSQPSVGSTLLPTADYPAVPNVRKTRSRAAPAVPAAKAGSDSDLHPAARKLLAALAQHAPGRFTWGQAATLAGLKPSGGHFNSGRKSLREFGYIAEGNDLIAATETGLKAAGTVPPRPSTPAERLAMWCDRLPSPAPEMLRALAAQGERTMDTAELAAVLGKKPTGGHWNSGMAVLRNNGLIEVDGRRVRTAELLRSG
jgi:uncharacterized protein